MAESPLRVGELAAFATAMPKVELHVHLEGTMRPATLLELARRRRVSLPADSLPGLREWFQFRDFDHFVEVYVACSRVLRQPEDFQRLVADFAEEQARQNVLYSEVHFTIGTHLMNGVNGDEVRDGLWEAAQAAERQHGVGLRWIPDIVRNVPYKWADKTVEWALDGVRHGVVALGLAGVEKGMPNEPFREHFAAARQAGLHTVAHAGEHAGPESIRSVLDVCAAERIGHGVRCLEDPVLVDELRAKGIPLEVCPTSNVQLGVVSDLAAHPFDELRRAGLELTVGSDDPPLFNTTLSDEYARLAETFGYDRDDLAELALASLRHSFLPAAEKERLEGERRWAMSAE